ncbi:MAG: 2-hydroxyacyl-CoA dehydratase family protein [Ardenticatenaceae bacterium]|nr:2-hydroxyacyl-CoA dehydratase family protein [Ardenticatenaceae bacterium]
MTDKKDGHEIVGRGAKDGGRLFREWFARLTTAAEQGEYTAYVFVMGSMAEILRVFDLHTSFPEINSLQTAVRRVAHEYLSTAEDYGYSPDICGYVKADVGMQLRNGEHPMGRVPKPSIAVLTNACNTYLKWGEIWERFYNIPTFAFDVPGSRSAIQANNQTLPGDADFERDRRYVEYQVKELIGLCEQVTGKKFDIDRLREILGHTNEMSRSWKRVLELNQSIPAPFNAMSEGTIYLGVANALRGTPEGSAYFRDLAEEMEYKSVHGIGTLPEEKYRLIFVGVPCYPIFRRFYELFAEWGQLRRFLVLVVRGGRDGFGVRVRPEPPAGEPGGRDSHERAPCDGCYVLPEQRPRRHGRHLPRRWDRLPPHQKLPHRLHRPGRQSSRRDGRLRRHDLVHRVGHDGQAGGLRSADEEPYRCLL